MRAWIIVALLIGIAVSVAFTGVVPSALAQEVATSATEPGLVDLLATKYGAYLGLAVAFVVFFDRLAKITPSDADNRIVAIAQKVFAVLGLKVPDIGAKP